MNTQVADIFETYYDNLPNLWKLPYIEPGLDSIVYLDKTGFYDNIIKQINCSRRSTIVDLYEHYSFIQNKDVILKQLKVIL